MEVVWSLFEDERIGFGHRYTSVTGTAGLRFCGPCDTAIVAKRCPTCGRFIPREVPGGWYDASMMTTRFTDQMEAEVPHATRTHSDPADRDVFDGWE